MKERWFPRIMNRYELERSPRISTRRIMLGALVAVKVMIEALPEPHQDGKVYDRVVHAIAKARRLG